MYTFYKESLKLHLFLISLASHRDRKDRACALLFKTDFMMCLPETIWHDGEQPGIPDISSYSKDQEGPSQPHLVEITCTGS